MLLTVVSTFCRAAFGEDQGGFAMHDCVVSTSGCDWLATNASIDACLTDKDGKLTTRPTHLQVRNRGTKPCYVYGTQVGGKQVIATGEERLFELHINSASDLPSQRLNAPFRVWSRSGDPSGFSGRWNLPRYDSAWSDGEKAVSGEGIATITVSGGSAKLVFAGGQTMLGSVRGNVLTTSGDRSARHKGESVVEKFNGTFTLSEDGDSITEEVHYSVQGVAGNPTREVSRAGERVP